MAIVALYEDSRTTAYRQRLAALLRRPACEWMAFSIGTAPVHRGFFADVAAAIEGRPVGGQQDLGGINHRQVQYAVRLTVGSQDLGRATYDPARRLLAVPDEADLDSLDGQAALVAACVQFGLHLKGRNLQPLDTQSAARIAAHLFRLFETVDDDGSADDIAAAFAELEPAAEADKAFFAVAKDILSHHRATCQAALRARQKLAPGSFMKIVGTQQRERLHAVLARGRAGASRRALAPRLGDDLRPARFLALQTLSAATGAAA